jgi:hypothetical protein
MYPLESYVDQEDSVEQLPLHDEGALLTALMTASAHNDYVSYQGVTSQTRQLIADAISHLNGLLNRDDDPSRNSAICIIMHLCAVAIFCGEHNAAFTHLHGVFEFLRLYKAQQESSGISPTIGQARYEMLKFRIERTAFCLYFITGRSGPWFSKPLSWYSLDSDAGLPCREVLTGSPKLDSVFSDFRALCREFQQRSASRLKVEAQYFRNAIHSLQIRVLALPPGEGTPFAECLRLAITAALTSQTQLPPRRLEHPYLNDQFHHYLSFLKCPVDQRGRDVVLWIMMAAFAVALDPERESEAWAEALFREVAGDDDWETARLRIMSVNWLPKYMDVQNEKTFKTLRRRWPPKEKGQAQKSHSGLEMPLPVRLAQLASEIEQF